MYLSNRYPSSISLEQLIRAYKHGIFPMADSRKDKKIIFIDPEYRALIPISKFKTSKSLVRLAKKRPFEISMNKAFAEVIRSCATINRTETWINYEIENLFISLNKLGYAHSVECWQNKQLIGGIYGVALGGVFFAESMFSYISNGSKIALINLVARLWKSDFKILDVQFLNDHLIQFGAYEINKTKFKQRLDKAIGLKTNFYFLPSTDNDFFNCLSTFLQARIETS